MNDLDSILDQIRRGDVPHGEESERDQKRVEDDLAEKLRQARVRFEGDIRALYRFMLDPKAPAAPKAVAVAALLYFILPVDVVPDFIPVLGFADDAAVIAAAVRYVGRELSAYRRSN